MPFDALFITLFSLIFSHIKDYHNDGGLCFSSSMSVFVTLWHSHMLKETIMSVKYFIELVERLKNEQICVYVSMIS